MKTAILPLLALLLMVSCGAPTATSEFTTIRLDEVNLDTTVDIAKENIIKLKDPKIILPEYTPDSQLGYCLAMGAEGDIMLLWEAHTAKIYLFNSESGKYISSFNRKGKSNKEYIGSLSAPTVEFSTREIFVADAMGGKIVVYNFEGEYQRHIKADSIASLNRVAKNRYVVLNKHRSADDSYKYNLCLLDREFNFIKGLDLRTEADRDSGGIIGALRCQTSPEGLYVTMRDTIFNATTDGLTPRYVVDKGRYQLPENVKPMSKEARQYVVFANTKILGNYLLYNSYRHNPDGSGNVTDIYDLRSSKLIYRKNAKDQKGVPVNYDGTIIYVSPGLTTESGRIYFILMDESVEELGIDNDGNPVFISAFVE